MKTVLIVNDDGPCCNDEAPFLLCFVRTLYHHAMRLHGDDIRIVVVTPAVQQSWVGKGITRADSIQARRWEIPECLREECEKMPQVEWFTVEGSPATTSHIAFEYLSVLSPRCKGRDIDLVISGPNKGRNSGTAFSLSSGTLGAALEVAMKAKGNKKPLPIIALSYALKAWPHWENEQVVRASEVAVGVINNLYENWPANGEVEIYSINVPLVLSSPSSPVVHSTSVNASTHYPNLYRCNSNSSSSSTTTTCSSSSSNSKKRKNSEEEKTAHPVHNFSFGLLDLSAMVETPGTDAWCVTNGYVSVTPFLARYQESHSVHSSEVHKYPFYTAEESQQ